METIVWQQKLHIRAKLSRNILTAHDSSKSLEISVVDRKERTLPYKDITHYQRIVAALAEQSHL